MGQGRGKQSDIKDEGNNRSESNGIVHSQRSAHDANGNIADIADNHHQRLHYTGNKLRFPVGIIDIPVQLLKVIHNLVACPGNADNLVTGVHFLHITIERTDMLLFGHKVTLGAPHQDHQDKHSHKGNSNHTQCQSPLRHKHHDQAAHKLCHRADNTGKALRKTLLQHLDIVGHTAQNIALCCGIKVAEGNFIDFLGKSAAELSGCPERYRRHDKMLNEIKNCTGNVNHNQRNTDFCNGGHIDLAKQPFPDPVGHKTNTVRADNGQNRCQSSQ